MKMVITWALVLYGVTGLLAWALWRQIRTGRIARVWSVRWPTILRAEQPLSFWATVAAQVLLLFVVGVFDLVLTHAVITSNSN